MPASFIDVVDGGNDHRLRNEKPEQPGNDVRVKAVAVHQVGAKTAKKAARAGHGDDKTSRIPAHLEADDRQAGGPLLPEARAQDEERDRVATPGHALSQLERLAFRSADAQRREHVDDPH